MNTAFFEDDINNALKVLLNGGVILYPTDTIWGLGCDATNKEAIDKIYKIKRRDDSKSMIILLADERDILQYVAAPPPEIFDIIALTEKPTTFIFSNALHLPDNLVAVDGSIGIRIVKDDFCKYLVKRLRKPLVSTSANISGYKSPQRFTEISGDIKSSVDYTVKWRQKENKEASPSRILKINADGTLMTIRD